MDKKGITILKTRLTIILLTIVISMTLSGCGTLGKIAGSVKEAASQASEAEVTAKHNAYVALGNYMTTWIIKTYASYFEQFGANDELAVKKNFRGFTTLPVLPAHKETVDKALSYASKEPSYQAADEAVKAMVPKLKEFMETTGEMQTYYQSKGYEGDDFAKGKELHKKIMAQFPEVSLLSDKFFADFAVITEQRKKDDLEKLKKNDFMVRYYAMSILNRAQDIQKAFSDAEVSDDNILDFDAAKYAELYKLLTDDIDKFKEVSKDKERLKKEGISVVPVFTDSLERVRTAGGDLMEILRTKDTTINSDTKGKMTTGGRNAPLYNFDRRVSSLVDSYNTMIRIN